MNSNYFKNINSYNSYIVKDDKNFLNVLSVNIRSVSSISKFNRFKSVVSQLSKLPEIIAIQETWFSGQYLNLYEIDGFDVIHCERYDGYGGTSIYVNSNLRYKVILRKSEDNLDVIAIELQDMKVDNSNIVLMSIYRSQRCKLSCFLEKMESFLQNLAICPVLIVGDVNVDMFVTNRSQRLLNDIFSDYNMKSCHNHITRPRSKKSIDWVYSNKSENVFVHSIENDLSDHNILSCGIYLNLRSQNFVSCQRQKLQYDEFERILDNALPSLQNLNNSSVLCEKFIQIYGTAVSRSTITTNQCLEIRKKMTPWMTDNLLSLINYKNKLLKSRRKMKDKESITEHLKRISKVIKISNKNLMENYYSHNLRSYAGDPKKTWQFLNKELGRTKKPVKEILTEEGDSIVSDDRKAIAFNNYFVNSINRLKGNIDQYPDDDINNFRSLIPERSYFNLQRVNTNQIENILDSLKFKKSSGYDNITLKMLLCRRSAVVDILVRIFNNMIIDQKYPNALKIHKIIPIPKKTNPKNIADYRPISVLSIIDKIFEKIIFEQLSNYIEENNILYKDQYGFKKGSGAEDAMVNVLEYICGGIDAGFKGVAGVFFDFSKAFDLVQHDILIKKLENIGLSVPATNLIKDYLQNRFQYVQVNNSKSSMLPVKHGVPQGSVLGPILFKIYINDLKNINFNGKLFLFADDVCIFYKYKHEQVLKTQIEYDAAILSEFARMNKLVLNPTKTKFIRFKPYVRRNDGTMIVHVGGMAIKESKCVKYLGINMNHNLLWDSHITEIKSKISSATGVLYKFKNKLNTETKMLIYQSLIHSHLTYLPLIYAWRNNSSLRSLQAAQNKALKIVFNLPIRYPSLSLYTFKATNILPIYGLYKQHISVYIFKSIRGIRSGSMIFNQNISRTARNTRQADNIDVVRCRLDLTKQRITYAGPNIFNSLPASVKNTSVISTFKLNIKSHLLQNLETLLM